MLKERPVFKEKSVIKAQKPFSQDIFVVCPGKGVISSEETFFQSRNFSKLKERAYEKQRGLLWEARIKDATDE